MRPAGHHPRLVTLIVSSALSVLALNMFLPSLANIAADYRVSYAQANLSVAGFLLISAPMQLLIGPLSDRYGRRPVLIGAAALFTVASIGAALAQTIIWFLLFRLLQSAVVAGTVVPRAAIRDMYDPTEAARTLGYVTMAMAVAPMLGPMLGGVLDSLFGWRASFWLYSLMGALVLALVWVDFGETNTLKSGTFRQQMALYPLLFRARRFWGYSVCIAFGVGGFYCFITGAPMVATAWFDLNTAQVGLGIGIITGGFVVGNYVSARLVRRLPLLTLILAGRVSSLLGPLLGLAAFGLGLGNVAVFFASAVLVGFGNGLTVANASAGLMSIRPELAGSASGLSGALGVAIGALLTSATGSLVTESNAPFAVLGLIVLCSVIALAGALYVRWVDLQEPATTV
ncbi:multidrug effflux MFS transporter [Phaeobacter sp.]|uniref:multidrug effflux MFS transporter n=1 Tax=Phaeobacter sp. TaxID=1902409 RepID=UPI0025E9FD2A|nr:multidrug effflux MFS transporter [Phaeobacter sp.]